MRTPVVAFVLAVLGATLGCGAGGGSDTGDPGATACAPRQSFRCDDHVVWWVDGCGMRTEVKADCTPGTCYGDRCIPPPGADDSEDSPAGPDDARRDDATSVPDTCPPGQTCTPDAGTCHPDCPAGTCGGDGCGGQCVCPLDGVCLPDGTCCTPQCPEGSCRGDGCGRSCACPAGRLCVQDGACCKLDCAIAECGDDGCGGTCGTCSAGEACIDSRCECVHKVGKYTEYCKNGYVFRQEDETTHLNHSCPADAPCTCGRCADGSCSDFSAIAEPVSCPESQTCCLGELERAVCCSDDEVCALGQSLGGFYPFCIAPGDTVCASHEDPIACRDNEVCCIWGSSAPLGTTSTCCPPGSTCCQDPWGDYGGVCCLAGEYCATTDGAAACCPLGSTVCRHDFSGMADCCTPGQWCSLDGCVDACGADEIPCESSGLKSCCPWGCSALCEVPPCCLD